MNSFVKKYILFFFIPSQVIYIGIATFSPAIALETGNKTRELESQCYKCHTYTVMGIAITTYLISCKSYLTIRLPHRYNTEPP